MEKYSKVEIIFGDISSNPRCLHGPSLLMERNGNRFYACSAYRSRRDCDFYQKAGDKMSASKAGRLSHAAKEYVRRNDHAQMWRGVRRALEERREVSLCEACGELRTKERCCSAPKIASLTHEQLLKPTKVLMPRDSDKKEAQYFFSSTSLDFLVSTISSLGFTDVLCIGSPSVFEALTSTGVNRLLLDIDVRFQHFYSPQQFVWFNFFNDHFFHGEKARQVLQNFFIAADKLLIVLDPPFGAKTDLVAHSLKRIKSQAKNLSISVEVSIVWVFPYFMESQVLSCSPDLAMADYRVTYTNHKEFKEAENKHSPVRLFTNIPLRDLKLPENEGYRHCGKCERWVAKDNSHCNKCGSCPSKTGRAYVHCSSCRRCVKQTYVHCNVCHSCKLPQHKCRDEDTGVPPAAPSTKKLKLDKKKEQKKRQRNKQRAKRKLKA